MTSVVDAEKTQFWLGIGRAVGNCVLKKESKYEKGSVWRVILYAFLRCVDFTFAFNLWTWQFNLIWPLYYNIYFLKLKKKF